MPRSAAVPDPTIVRLLEEAERQRVGDAFDWLPEAEQAARARTVREVAGAVLSIETQPSGKRTANVRILAMSEPLTRDGLEQILSAATDDGARTIRFHVLKTDSNKEVVEWLRVGGFRGKQGLVHWIAPANTVSNGLAGQDVRQIGPADTPEFARIVGVNYRFKSPNQVAALIHETSAPWVACFLAYVDGIAVGTGLVHHVGSVCDLGYGTTLRAYRGRGIQQAIIAARVQHANAIGCQWATACTMGLDRSSRNLVRQGFRKAYSMADFERTV